MPRRHCHQLSISVLVECAAHWGCPQKSLLAARIRRGAVVGSGLGRGDSHVASCGGTSPQIGRIGHLHRLEESAVERGSVAAARTRVPPFDDRRLTAILQFCGAFLLGDSCGQRRPEETGRMSWSTPTRSGTKTSSRTFGTSREPGAGVRSPWVLGV
jgi:hypothetical protein